MEAQEAPKSRPKREKINVKKQHVFEIDFWVARAWFLIDFLLVFWIPNPCKKQHEEKRPRAILYCKNQQKRLLKDIAYEYIPRSLLDRPKSGFVPPISKWLKSDLKDWSVELLNSHEDEFINVEYSRKIFRDHIDGKMDHSIPLWKILMFLDWKKRWL